MVDVAMGCDDFPYKGLNEKILNLNKPQKLIRGSTFIEVVRQMENSQSEESAEESDLSQLSEYSKQVK